MLVLVYIAGVVTGVLALCVAVGAGFTDKEGKYGKADNI